MRFLIYDKNGTLRKQIEAEDYKTADKIAFELYGPYAYSAKSHNSHDSELLSIDTPQD